MEIVVKKKKKILVVDDMGIFRRYLIQTLSLLGYEAEGVAGIDELDSFFCYSNCDLVLLDWNIGGETAIGAFDTLKDMGIPVIIVTGDPDSVSGIDCPVLGKPFPVMALKKSIQETWSH